METEKGYLRNPICDSLFLFFSWNFPPNFSGSRNNLKAVCPSCPSYWWRWNLRQTPQQGPKVVKQTGAALRTNIILKEKPFEVWWRTQSRYDCELSFCHQETKTTLLLQAEDAVGSSRPVHLLTGSSPARLLRRILSSAVADEWHTTRIPKPLALAKQANLIMSHRLETQY